MHTNIVNYSHHWYIICILALYYYENKKINNKKIQNNQNGEDFEASYWTKPL